jgi:hypothetical protein
MRTAGQELTLSSALSDALIRTVMAADNIDPTKLEAMLREIAREISWNARDGAPARVDRDACVGEIRFRPVSVLSRSGPLADSTPYLAAPERHHRAP